MSEFFRPTDPSVFAEFLSYDATTGLLTWRERDSKWFAISSSRSQHSSAQSWNRRYAGTPALSTPNNRGYLFGSVLKQLHTAHRVIWCLHHGAGADGFIDHIDGCKTNNRIDNLRLVSRSQNARNAKQFSTNSSGFTGVKLVNYPSGILYRARAHINGKDVHIGLFRSMEDAIAARTEFNAENGFWPNHGSKSA